MRQSDSLPPLFPSTHCFTRISPSLVPYIPERIMKNSPSLSPSVCFFRIFNHSQMIGCSNTSSLESVRNLKVDCSTNVALKSSAINRYNELVKFLLNRHGMLVFLRIPNNLDLFFLNSLLLPVETRFRFYRPVRAVFELGEVDTRSAKTAHARFNINVCCSY